MIPKLTRYSDPLLDRQIESLCQSIPPQKGNGSPLNVNVPRFLGDRYIDLVGLHAYTATTTDKTGWVDDTTGGGGGGTPAISVVSETSYGQSSAVGVSTNYARQDHTHGTPATTKDTTAVTGILKGNGATISSATPGTDYLTDSSTNVLQNKTLNNSNNYIDADALHEVVYNNSGGALTIGQAVYNTQWNALNSAPEVILAQANNSTTAPCHGLVEDASIANGAVGSIRTSGILNNCNTNAWSSGQDLWLSPTVAGGLTTTEPTTVGQIKQFIGTVIRQHATLGIINVQLGPPITIIADDAPATTVTTQAFGDLGTVGTATNYAREDHKHAMPASPKDTTAITGILQGNGSTISAAANSTALLAVTNTNTGDVTLAVNSGHTFTSGQTGLALGTPSSVTASSTNSVTTTTHTHAITAGLGFIGNGSAQYQLPVTGATPFTPVWTTATGTGSPVLANTPTLTTPNIGAATGTSLAATGAVTSSGASIGYATGAGTTGTQSTSRTTAVTLGKAALCGTITLFSTTLAANTTQSFAVANTKVAATDIVLINHISGGTLGLYSFTTTPGASTFTVNVRNNTGTITPTEAPVIQFVVIKGVTA